MATYTPNLNLGKPEATDPFGNFRQLFNDNMDILDNGGGGGSSSLAGLTDVDLTTPTDGQVLTYDGNNSKWVNANASGGGGGSFFGCAIDENNKLFEGTINNFNQSLSYTATEDGIALCWYKGSVGTWQFLVVNGVMLRLGGNGTDQPVSYSVPIRKGDVVSALYQSGSESCYFWLSVYGIKQGTSGIFAPVIYSDNERKIGIWRDNKPLYQKTVTFDGARSHGSNVFSTGILDAEEIVSISGMASYASGGVNNKWIPFTFSDDSTQNGITNAVLKINSFLRSTGEIYAYIGADYQSTYAINRVRITIQYTKTTDVAGSGNWNTDGVPTVHYDTSEKVIGTYLGKPLYQITYSGLSLVCTNANQSYATNTDWGNIKKIVHSDIIDQYGQSCAGSVVYTGTPAKLAVYMQMANRTVTDITIQYTKTTD